MKIKERLIKMKRLVFGLLIVTGLMLTTNVSADEDVDYLIEEIERLEALIEELQDRVDALEGRESAEETLGSLEDPYDVNDIVEITTRTMDFDDMERIDFEGTATLQIDDIRPFDEAEAPEGYSWSLVEFTFERTDSLDPNTIFIDAGHFRVQTDEDTVTEQFADSDVRDELFSEAFLSVGEVVEGTLVLLTPIDEPYYIRFGDDVYFDVVYIEVGAGE